MEKDISMHSMINQTADPFSQKKGQHYLKSAGIKLDVNSYDIGRLSEEQSFEYFVTERWGSKEEVVCPDCGRTGKHYFKKNRRWQCEHTECGKYFSVFTGTVFHDRKLSYHKLLCFLTLFVIVPFGVSYTTAKGLISVQCKTVQVLIGKIRELIMRSANQTKLSGLVHMDGGYFGGKPRHGRVRRVDNTSIKSHVESMLLAKTKKPLLTVKANALRKHKNRRVVMVLREVSPIRGQGAVRTVVAIADTETENYSMSLALKYIEKGSTIMTDESPAYNQFSKYYDHQTVEHAKEFATIDGINSNQAESFFSRLRRYEYGVGLRIEPKYLLDVASEMAWREDVRRLSYGDRLSDISNMIFTHGRSMYWTGYWQGLNRPGKFTWSTEVDKSKLRPLVY